MRRMILLVLAVAGLSVIAAGCGDDDEKSSSGSQTSGNETDRAFAVQMVPHHEGAIEMAEVALKRAEHPALKRLARDIIAAQRAEIAILRPIDRELEGAGVAVGELGLDAHEMTMGGDVHALAQADRFDRSFIEMMVPHHESAVQMATVELRSGKHPRLRRLANEIIDAQRREIGQMKGWFMDWYGEDLGTAAGGHAG